MRAVKDSLAIPLGRCRMEEALVGHAQWRPRQAPHLIQVMAKVMRAMATAGERNAGGLRLDLVFVY